MYPDDNIGNEATKETILESKQPKYSAWGWQLNRLEKLMDICLNEYSNLSVASGRYRFASAIEAMYAAIAPRLKKEDRKYLKSNIIKIRKMVDVINNSSLNNTQTMQPQIDNLRSYCWSIMEILNLVKDRRGLGMELEEDINWKEDLAKSADIIPENILEKSKKV